MNLKKITFTLLLILFSFNLYSQEKQTVDSVNLEQSQILTDDSNPESKYVFTDIQPEQQNSRTNSGAWSFIKIILILAIVVALIYFVMNYMKKSFIGDSSKEDLYLRKVAYLNLAPGKSVQVVTLLDKCYLLGVSESNINLISTIEDKELIEAMNLNADKALKTKKAMNFNEVLEMFMPSKSTKVTEATQDNIYSDNSQNLNDFVTSQRKRINRNRKKE